MKKSLVFAGALLALLASASPAMDQSVAVIINPKNANTPSQEQIANIFLGKSNDLLGVDQPEGRSVREDFYQKVTGKNGTQLKAYWAKLVFTGKAQALKELTSDLEVKRFVASTPNAIGYIDKGVVDGSVKVVMTP